ncbi:hypothetical protein EON65_02020 [archaeon]|nr:MAG: hypothetical protein EON65_02020 [archaeon]
MILSTFPSYDKHTAGFSLYANAHTGPISNLAFTYLDSHFISVSAQDCCILQYKVVQNTNSAGIDTSKTSVAKIGKATRIGTSVYDYAAEVFANIYLGDSNKDKDKTHHWSGLIIDPTRQLSIGAVPINQVATSVEVRMNVLLT